MGGIINSIPIVSASDLKKTYYNKITGQSTRALDGVSLEVSEGEIFGILGPNGAGKTTLLNCLAMLLKPDSGEISLFGKKVKGSGLNLRMRLNMTSGNSNFPWCMTVEEILRFYGYFYGLWGDRLVRRLEELLALLDLGRFAKQRFDELSTGTKQRLAIAKSLLNSPELLFLDEPTIGLDPDVSAKMRSFIKDLNRSRKVTILLTTHYMAEAELLSHRILFLQKGRILAQGTPDQLKTRLVAKNMEEVFLNLSHSVDKDS